MKKNTRGSIEPMVLLIVALFFVLVMMFFTVAHLLSGRYALLIIDVAGGVLWLGNLKRSWERVRVWLLRQ